MAPRLLIKNGRIVDPASGFDAVADLAVADGRIAGMGVDLEFTGADVDDASGLIVAPGFIDIHVHLREPGIAEHAETIEYRLARRRRGWIHFHLLHAEYDPCQ